MWRFAVQCVIMLVLACVSQTHQDACGQWSGESDLVQVVIEVDPAELEWIKQRPFSARRADATIGVGGSVIEGRIGLHGNTSRQLPNDGD